MNALAPVADLAAARAGAAARAAEARRLDRLSHLSAAALMDAWAEATHPREAKALAYLRGEAARYRGLAEALAG